MAAGEARRVRSALTYWAFNKRRDSEDQPDDVTERLAWVDKHSKPVANLNEPGVIRDVLNHLGSKLGGGRAAATTVQRKRAVLSNALTYAVELGRITENPVTRGQMARTQGGAGD